MGRIKTLDQAFVNDGKGRKVLVKAGDSVELLNSSQNIPQINNDSLEKSLGGKGPYEISWIGKWPCGTIMLYLNLPNGREPGASASSFKYFKIEKQITR